MPKVLLTDGDYKNCLAAVRSLGRNKVTSWVLGESSEPMGACSKYCAGYFLAGRPTDPGFVDNLEAILKENKFDVLLPIGFDSSKSIIKNKARLAEWVKIPTVDYDKFLVAGKKDLTVAFAAKLGIKTPHTYEIHAAGDLEAINTFPVVLKPAQESGGVYYAQNAAELKSIHQKLSGEQASPADWPLVQEYVPGNNGYGFYAFYWQGELITSYMHQRMHMYPRTGGASTMARTYFDEPLFQQGQRLLDKLDWHGVAMVEFKKHELNGEYYLMEVNPKYWGSLDLALAAGLDIPYYHTMYALGDKVPIPPYQRDVCFRWIKNDLRYALAGDSPGREILQWMGLFFDRKVNDDLMLTDIKPTLHQLWASSKALFGKMRPRR